MASLPPPSPEELILRMLRDVLARQAAQMGLTPPAPTPLKEPPPVATPTPPPAPPPPALVVPPPPVASMSDEFEEKIVPLSRAEQKELDEFNEVAARPFASGQLPRTLRWLIGCLFMVLVLINIPFPNGAALARALPDRQSLIIRDGLLLKGPGPEVYVIENNAKRWISSLDAFEHYGYVWDDVHLVDDAFLNQFPTGRPLHVLLKCDASPHIYRLENDVKRWIKDIPTFVAEGHVWEDVRFVSCGYLRNLPDGQPIPPDAGPPPQP